MFTCSCCRCFMTHPGEFKAQGGKFMGANLKVFSLLNKFQQLFFFFVYLIASLFFFFDFEAF